MDLKNQSKMKSLTDQNQQKKNESFCSKPVAVSDRIFVRLEQEESKSGLVFLSDEMRPRSIGVVESVGPLVTSVQIGDKVLFHAFDELPSYDENVVVIRENSLLGVYSTQKQPLKI